jgi:ATP-dependent exoDNAse (exonuclease V) alpha subunit
VANCHFVPGSLIPADLHWIYENVTVRFEDREVEYSRFLLQQLIHRYAMSIHRSQGSEYPYVVIPIHESQA